jgi:hypothetical protein
VKAEAQVAYTDEDEDPKDDSSQGGHKLVKCDELVLRGDEQEVSS